MKKNFGKFVGIGSIIFGVFGVICEVIDVIDKFKNDEDEATE